MGFKKISALFLAIIFVLVLFGCKDDKGEIGSDYNFITDSQIAKTLDIGNVNIAKSPSGYYTLIGQKLYFVDGNSLEGTVLCSKPNCLHQDEQCNAVISALDNIAYNDNYIYCLTSAGAEKDFVGAYLVKVSQDGSTKENIHYIESNYTDWIIHRGYFYYSTKEFKINESTGLEDINKCDCYIYRFPLEGTGKEAEDIYFAEKIERDAQLSGLSVYGNNLYFDMYGMKRGTKTEEVRATVKLNLDSFSSSEMLTSSGDILARPRLLGDSLIFTSGENENGKYYYYKTDFEGNNPEKCFETYEGESVICDGTYLYVDNFYTLNMPDYIEETEAVNRTERYIKIYDSEFELIDEFSFGSDTAKSWHIIPVDDEIFLFAGKGAESDVIFYYDKSEFGTLKGKEWEKTFAYKEDN